MRIIKTTSRKIRMPVVILFGALIFLVPSSKSVAQIDSTAAKISMSELNGSPVTFKPKTKSKYEFGVHIGSPLIAGDVSPRPGFGGGFSLRKALNNAFSIRGEYTGAYYYGLDYRTAIPNQLPTNRTNDPWLIYYLPGNKDFVANYKTAMHQFSLQSVVSLNTFSTSRGNPKANIYIFGGYSLLLANVDVDALDANGRPYVITSQTSPINFVSGTRREIRKQLKNFMNLDYESSAGVLNGNRSPIGLPGNQLLRHSVNGGAGYAYKINDKINIAFEHRVTYAFSDDMDGIYKGRTNDMLHFTSLRFNINLGNKNNKSQPLWWINPYTTTKIDTSFVNRTTKDTVIIKNEAGTKDTVVMISRDTVYLKSPYPVDTIIKLSGVKYYFDKAELTDSAKQELDQLVQILSKYPSMMIELRSHTDSKGTMEYNIELSAKRAKSCVDYLISKGISPSRLESHGYGESIPVAPNTMNDGRDNPEGRAENRRTEFKVIRQ